MEYKIWLPHPVLKPYIRYYTYTELGTKDVWSSSAIAPTGCSAMCVIVGDHVPLFKDPKGEEKYECTFNVYGQSTCYTPFGFYGEHKVITAVFNPWGAFRLLEIGQFHFTDSNTHFFDLLSASDRAIKQQLMDCQNPEQTFSVLEAFFLRMLFKKKEKNNFERIVSVCNLLMKKSYEPLLLKEICKNEGFSKSALERNFKEFVGIGIKQYHRILRFHNLLTHIKQQKDFRHWTEVAYHFGYYDQAHFIKDFKGFYGKTPSEFSSTDELISNMIV